MTNAELMSKAKQAVEMLLQANPDANTFEIMLLAYFGGLTDGGRIVSAHLEGWATMQKAMITKNYGPETLKTIKGR